MERSTENADFTLDMSNASMFKFQKVHHRGQGSQLAAPATWVPLRTASWRYLIRTTVSYSHTLQFFKSFDQLIRKKGSLLFWLQAPKSKCKVSNSFANTKKHNCLSAMKYKMKIINPSIDGPIITLRYHEYDSCWKKATLRLAKFSMGCCIGSAKGECSARLKYCFANMWTTTHVHLPLKSTKSSLCLYASKLFPECNYFDNFISI